MKLLGRHSAWGRRIVLDMWAGGRLRMRTSDGSGGPVRFELVEPLRDPWVFRWYDAKDEVKLGVAVSVPDPSGHPYGSLAATLEPLARQRYREWWDADRVDPTADERPAWSTRADAFWAERHRGEERIRDPLHSDPVYPFHVLGDPAGRFVFETRPDGAVNARTIRDRMSEPWLSNGWADWLTGKRREGYGYWENGPRPAWEPSTYPALAAALRLLGWSCPGEEGRPGSCRMADEQGPIDLAARLQRVVEILNPRLSGRFRWSDAAPPFEVKTVTIRGFVVESVAETPARVLHDRSGTRYRLWRFTRFDRRPGRVVHDEFQALVEDEPGGTVKLWLKVGYRPWPPPPASEKP